MLCDLAMKNVMMEILLMTMDVAKTARLKTDGNVQSNHTARILQKPLISLSPQFGVPSMETATGSPTVVTEVGVDTPLPTPLSTALVLQGCSLCDRFEVWGESGDDPSSKANAPIAFI